MEKNKTSIESIKILNRRSFIILFLGSIVSFFVLLRLYSLQVINFALYKKKSIQNKITVKAIPPLRGDIFDNKRRLIAGNSSFYEFILFKNLNKKFKDEINHFNLLLDLKLDIQKILSDIEKQSLYVPYKISRANWDQIVKFEKNKFLFTAIKISESKKRFYPYQNMSQILGYIGSSNQKTDLYPKGVFHVEKTYENLLKGKAGKIFNEVNSRGQIVREVSIEQPIKGRDLNLTINLDLQNYAQSILPKSNKGSIVVLNCQDGSILAMNSNPTFDSQTFEDRDNDEIERLLKDPSNPLINRAFSGFYPPGSVFKPIPTLLGLQKNLINENTEVVCKGHSSLKDRNYYCWKKQGHGKVNLKKAIKESCDVYFYELAKKVNIDDLSTLATNLGLNQKYDIGLSNIQKGLVPNKKWKKAYLDESWYLGETLITSIGQGFNLTSPLQLATLYSALINGGKYPKPRINRKQDILFEGNPFEKKYKDIIIDSLNAAVQEPTGTAFKLNNLHPNFVKIGGKTGTSQVVRIKEEDREDDLYKSKDVQDRFKDHSVFVGYAPFDRPRYIASVIIENGGSGSSVAAPIAHKVLNFAHTLNV